MRPTVCRTSSTARTRRIVLLVIAFLSSACYGARSKVSQLERGMAPAEVRSILGDPTVSESTTKDGKPVDYWSYVVAHRVFSRSATFECLTFVDGRLTEWVEDYGVGGHSNHRRP